MTFLSLPTALTAAALAVPALLLLYFLKLRRQERRVSSTLLWRRAVEDLRVNAPFQRLRKNLLLFLQLLVLAFILFALANPVMNMERAPRESVVILLDHSASMTTVESDGRSRLEHAKNAASHFVDDLPAGSRAMVVTFSDRANVACSFTDDTRRLKRAIEEIEPTDGPSRLSEALQLAVAYSSNLVEVTGTNVPEAAQQGVADLELFSDGRIVDADQQFVTRGRLRYLRVGEASDNVGIVAFDVRRDFDRPHSLSVFCQVENFGPATVTTDVSLLLDGKPAGGAGVVREVTLGPGTTSQPASSDRSGPLPSSRNVVYELQHDRGGVIEVRIERADAFMKDNRVAAPIDPPRPIRVLIVTDRPETRRFLERAFSGLAVDAVDSVSASDYESLPETRFIAEGRSVYDIVVIDNHDTDRLPPGNYLMFNSLPKLEGFSRGEELVAKPLVWGREDHPLMRSVYYDNLFISKWRRLALPSAALSLLEGEDSVVLAMVIDPGHRYFIAAFDLLETDLPLKPAFPIFLQNTASYLAGGGALEGGRLLAPGDTITLTVPAGATRLRIHRPDGRSEDVDVTDRLSTSYARTRETGVYQAKFNDSEQTAETFGVNLLDRVESNIPPAETFVIGSESVASVDASRRINEALWPYAAATALLFVLLEWWVYHKRVMI